MPGREGLWGWICQEKGLCLPPCHLHEMVVVYVVVLVAAAAAAEEEEEEEEKKKKVIWAAETRQCMRSMEKSQRGAMVAPMLLRVEVSRGWEWGGLR